MNSSGILVLMSLAVLRAVPVHGIATSSPPLQDARHRAHVWLLKLHERLGNRDNIIIVGIASFLVLIVLSYMESTRLLVVTLGD